MLSKTLKDIRIPYLLQTMPQNKESLNGFLDKLPIPNAFCLHCGLTLIQRLGMHYVINQHRHIMVRRTSFFYGFLCHVCVLFSFFSSFFMISTFTHHFLYGLFNTVLFHLSNTFSILIFPSTVNSNLSPKPYTPL